MCLFEVFDHLLKKCFCWVCQSGSELYRKLSDMYKAACHVALFHLTPSREFLSWKCSDKWRHTDHRDPCSPCYYLKNSSTEHPPPLFFFQHALAHRHRIEQLLQVSDAGSALLVPVARAVISGPGGSTRGCVLTAYGFVCVWTWVRSVTQLKLLQTSSALKDCFIAANVSWLRKWLCVCVCVQMHICVNKLLTTCAPQSLREQPHWHCVRTPLLVLSAWLRGLLHGSSDLLPAWETRSVTQDKTSLHWSGVVWEGRVSAHDLRAVKWPQSKFSTKSIQVLEFWYNYSVCMSLLD